MGFSADPQNFLWVDKVWYWTSVAPDLQRTSEQRTSCMPSATLSEECISRFLSPSSCLNIWVTCQLMWFTLLIPFRFLFVFVFSRWSLLFSACLSSPSTALKISAMFCIQSWLGLELEQSLGMHLEFSHFLIVESGSNLLLASYFWVPRS